MGWVTATVKGTQAEKPHCPLCSRQLGAALWTMPGITPSPFIILARNALQQHTLRPLLQHAQFRQQCTWWWTGLFPTPSPVVVHFNLEILNWLFHHWIWEMLLQNFPTNFSPSLNVPIVILILTYHKSFKNVTPSSVKSKLLRVISGTPVHVNKITEERYFNKLKCTNVMMQKRNEAREMVGRNCALGCWYPPPTCALLTRGKPWAPQPKSCYSNPATATNSQTSSLNQFIPIASSTDKTQGIHIMISPPLGGSTTPDTMHCPGRESPSVQTFWEKYTHTHKTPSVFLN